MYDSNVIPEGVSVILDTKRNFGVEIEMSTEFEKVKNIISPYLNKKSIIFETFNIESSNKKKWYLKIDGTTESELTTPAICLKSENYIKLKELLKVLIRNRVKVTDRDGLHVHIECADVAVGQLIASWIYFEKALISLFPKHRSIQNNGCYSKRFIGQDSTKKISDVFQKSLDTSYHEKYSAISLRHYSERKTAEFRMAEGMIRFQDIDCWLKILLHLIDFSRKCDICNVLTTKLCDRPNYNEVYSLLCINAHKIRNWICYRIDRFSKK